MEPTDKKLLDQVRDTTQLGQCANSTYKTSSLT
jgi:hypothetical protein